MTSSIREFAKFAAVPILFLVLAVSLVIVWRVLDLPEDEELYRQVEGFYERYGYLSVFLGALGEGLLFVTWYVPGSIVIVLGVAFAQGEPVRAAIAVGYVIVAFYLTALLNYAMGKYGWYYVFMKAGLRTPLERMKQRVEQSGLAIVFLTYFHPSFGSLTATAAGILRASFKKFAWYSFIAVVAWNAFWGGLTYFAGPILLKAVSTPVVFTVFGAWVVVSLVVFLRRRRKVAIVN